MFEKLKGLGEKVKKEAGRMAETVVEQAEVMGRKTQQSVKYNSLLNRIDRLLPQKQAIIAEEELMGDPDVAFLDYVLKTHERETGVSVPISQEQEAYDSLLTYAYRREAIERSFPITDEVTTTDEKIDVYSKKADKATAITKLRATTLGELWRNE